MLLSLLRQPNTTRTLFFFVLLRDFDIDRIATLRMCRDHLLLNIAVIPTRLIDNARGRASHGAKFLVVEDAVDAAVHVAETFGRADLAATRATAFGAPERAARRAVVVLAFEARDAVAARLFSSSCREDGPSL